jgi:hypothetical protein
MLCESMPLHKIEVSIKLTHKLMSANKMALAVWANIKRPIIIEGVRKKHVRAH